MRGSRWVSVVVLVGLSVSACGGGGSSGAGGTAGTGGSTGSAGSAAPATNKAATTAKPAEVTAAAVLDDKGHVTPAALAAIAAPSGDGVDQTKAEALAQAVLALPTAERTEAFADLSRRLELEAAKVSGLEAAVGSPEGTEAALRGAWGQINASTGALGTLPPLVPSGTGRSALPRNAQLPAAGDGSDAGTATGTGALGVLMGAMGLALTADAIVSTANDFKADQYAEDTSNGRTITGAVEQSSIEMEFNGKQDGVDIAFKAQSVVHPCPKADGSFDIQIKLDVKTAKGGTGTNATIDVDVNGTVDDNAELVKYDSTNHTQWADFGGGKGQFLDYTVGTSGGKMTKFTTNRTGGTGTEGMTVLAVLMGMMFESMVSERYVDAAKKAWQSGRCVELKLSASPGPKGLKPSSTASVLAEPRSKVDGSPAGGSVTAKLSAGGASVAPSGSKVAADATFTYTAPSERNKNGVVDAEARSRRGIGKASITLDTAVPAAFHIVGGLDDFQVNQDVCDVMQPFSLSGGGAVANFSGGLSGTYTGTGPFGGVYDGEYEITLAADPTQPAAMVGGGVGTVHTPLGAASNTGTEHYVLTPIAPCN